MGREMRFVAASALGKIPIRKKTLFSSLAQLSDTSTINAASRRDATAAMGALPNESSVARETRGAGRARRGAREDLLLSAFCSRSRVGRRRQRRQTGRPVEMTRFSQCRILSFVSHCYGARIVRISTFSTSEIVSGVSRPRSRFDIAAAAVAP